jgi:DUF4097 and DUF4098 domain-containing protein YvlB
MEERERILKMLEEGKITADQAARLLEALGEPYRFMHRPGKDFGERIARKVELSLKDLPDTIAASISGMGHMHGSGCKKLEFDPKETLTLKSVSGDVQIKGDDEKTIRIDLCGGHRIKEEENELVLKTMAGDIDIQVNRSQNVEMKAAAGDVSVSDLDGALTIRCGGGDLDLNNIAGKLTIGMGGGDLDAKNVSGELNIKVGGGDIDLDLAACPGGNIELGGGSVDLAIAEKADVELVLYQPKEGSISSEFDLKPSKEDEEELHAAVGKPKGKLFVRVKHGDITIHKRNKK